MVEVLSVGTDGSLTVSSIGLRRVVIQPENVIADELVTAAEADAFVSTFNACNPSRVHWAESHSYMASLAVN